MAKTWNAPVELSEKEERVMKRVKKNPLFRFFRTYRHELFDGATQAKLLKAYSPKARGKEAHDAVGHGCDQGEQEEAGPLPVLDQEGMSGERLGQARPDAVAQVLEGREAREDLGRQTHAREL